MLEMTEQYRKAFEAMGDEGMQNVCHFDEEEGSGRLGQPKDMNWKNVKVFVEFLRLFYGITCTIFSSLYVTSNECWQQVCQVKEQLGGMCESVDPTLM